MLIIRKAQMEAFRSSKERQFVQKAVKHLETAIPERCLKLGSEAVIDSVHTALRKGKEYGMESEFDFLRYLNLMYTAGFEFDTETWAAELLGNAKLDPGVKLELLRERVRQKQAGLEEKSDV